MKIDTLVQLADDYYQEALISLGRIRKLPNGKYRVLSEKGKNLGTSDSRKGAEKRLRQVEYFKHKDKNSTNDSKTIDLTDIDDFSYSAIMRKLNQKAEFDQVKQFMNFFKKEFDKAVKNKIQKPEKVALQNSLIKFNKICPIKLKKKLVKSAAVSELGNPILVGKYLADIVRFTLNKMEPQARNQAIDSLRKKFYVFNADEIANKKMPPTSSIGQAIIFVKHVLFNQQPDYIRAVINNLVRDL
jgi:hypothetical protein